MSFRTSGRTFFNIFFVINVDKSIELFTNSEITNKEMYIKDIFVK